jgi:arsenite methyltransferase
MAFSEPKKIVDQCGVQVGQIIADFGAGSGFYVLESARALMSTGKVYAIDVQKDILSKIESEARKENLSNVDVIWGDVEKLGGTKLKDSSIDLVLVCNLLFQVQDKKSLFAEAKRILVSGGRMLVVDWEDSFGGIGPHRDQVVTKEDCVELFEMNGFAKERDINAGSHHYGFVFKKL